MQSKANLATAPWLLLNLADQESAAVEPSTRKGSRALSGAFPPPLLVADQATRPMLSAVVVFPELSRPWAEAASARLCKSRLPLHIASLSLRLGAADSAWLKAT